MPSPLVSRLVESRSVRLAQWMNETRGGLTAPEGADAPAVNALLIAGIQQLVIAASANGQFAGLALRDDEDWLRLKAAVSAVIRATYGAQPQRS